ncbi:ERF family protein [Brevibacillus centrosporus]|uniref:ERF family protein n=1 Tax=Brevibacillus centrosporus TaxID=54910 RepID=UPI002E2150F3|nr:ERF family protein [Brevibacillus centrosporus]
MSKAQLYKKIHEVMKEVEYLQKDDLVAFKETRYKAISEEKVTSTVRASLIKHGLVIIPIEQKHSKEGNLTSVDVTYKIVDIDTGEFETAVSSGTGADTQDKGVGKAMTYAYKYLLLRTFAIPTGDDPDKISSAELDSKASAVIKAKYEALKGSQDGFDDWYLQCINKGMKDKEIEQGLTKKLAEKQQAAS